MQESPAGNISTHTCTVLKTEMDASNNACLVQLLLQNDNVGVTL